MLRSGARNALANDLRRSTDCGATETSEVDPHDLRDGARARDRAEENEAVRIARGKQAETRASPTVSRSQLCIRLASSAGSSPTPASLCLLVGTLLFEYSGSTNLVVEHPIKDTFLYYMSPDIPRAASTAVCCLKRRWKCSKLIN